MLDLLSVLPVGLDAAPCRLMLLTLPQCEMTCCCTVPAGNGIAVAVLMLSTDLQLAALSLTLSAQS